MAGSWWRGRPVTWDADARAIENERQRWVGENLAARNDMITELSVDPDQAYQQHRAEYERTGDLAQLQWALAYVRAEAD